MYCIWMITVAWATALDWVVLWLRNRLLLTCPTPSIPSTQTWSKRWMVQSTRVVSTWSLSRPTITIVALAQRTSRRESRTAWPSACRLLWRSARLWTESLLNKAMCARYAGLYIVRSDWHIAANPGRHDLQCVVCCGGQRSTGWKVFRTKQRVQGMQLLHWGTCGW